MGAKKPCILLGGGAKGATDQIRRFAAATGIPVACTFMGIGVVPAAMNGFGMIGHHGHRHANFAVYASGVLMAIGVRFDERAAPCRQQFAPGARIIQASRIGLVIHELFFQQR